MSPVLLFVMILLLTVGVVLVALRPSKTEMAVQKQLAMIERLTQGTGGAAREDLYRRVVLSDTVWLNELMQRVKLCGDLHRLIAQSGSNWTVGSLLLGSLLIAFSVPWIIVYLISYTPPLLALIAGLIVASIPYLYLFWKRAVVFRRFEAYFPDAIDLMSRSMRAGHTITSAIEMVAEEVPDPVGGEFRRIFEEQNFGLPLRDALLNLADRVPLQDVRFLVTAMLVQRETGGNLAEILDKTATVIRERFRLRGQIRIYSAQGRLTGWILATLPFVMFILLGLINPGYVKLLLTDPAGRKLTYAGLALMGVGGWMMRKIVNIKV